MRLFASSAAPPPTRLLAITATTLPATSLGASLLGLVGGRATAGFFALGGGMGREEGRCLDQVLRTPAHMCSTLACISKGGVKGQETCCIQGSSQNMCCTLVCKSERNTEGWGGFIARDLHTWNICLLCSSHSFALMMPSLAKFSASCMIVAISSIGWWCCETCNFEVLRFMSAASRHHVSFFWTFRRDIYVYIYTYIWENIFIGGNYVILLQRCHMGI